MEIAQTEIADLYYIKLDIYPDKRGNFREAWQQEKLTKLGLPQIAPVQFNVAESVKGVTRGIHAEPWQKYLHVAYGEVFAAIVDIRPESNTFGKVLTFNMNSNNALLIPIGCANSYQVLSERASYTYLVTAHWKAKQRYAAIALNDSTLNIQWPIPKDNQIISEKDLANPTLKELFPSKF
jgi:dTDP-4-dehydrorhamnose 3,5-epimerase